MKLIIENGICIGYDYTEAETEAIKAGNTAIVEAAAKSFASFQKELTERWKNHNDSVLKFKELDMKSFNPLGIIPE